MDFQIWDFPGQLDYFDPAFDSGDIFKNIGALIWVIDAQDDYNDSLNRLVVTIMNLQSTEYRDILVEVFIHKTDGLPDEIKGDVYTDITSRVSDELADAGYINPRVTYHVTSIFDSSIFEALSRVIQKLIPELNTLQNLLNILADHTGMEKVYLFDINSKIYVASDTRPVDMGSYEMSSAMIDFVLDTIDLFNYPRKNSKPLGAQMDEVEASVTFSHDASLMLILKEVNRYVFPCITIGCLLTRSQLPYTRRYHQGQRCQRQEGTDRLQRPYPERGCQQGLCCEGDGDWQQVSKRGGGAASYGCHCSRQQLIAMHRATRDSHSIESRPDIKIR